MSKMSTYEVILTSTPDGATWYGDQRRCHTDERVHVTATTLVEAITVAESMNPGTSVVQIRRVVTPPETTGERLRTALDDEWGPEPVLTDVRVLRGENP